MNGDKEITGMLACCVGMFLCICRIMLIVA